jgi:diguanylate cyclase (GGDEF)-like protein
VRLITRHDTSLAVALIVSAFVLFHQPLRFLVDAAGEAERQYHIDLIPSLLLLGVVFAFHQYRKRQEAHADARAASAEAAQERIRAEELERLVGLSRAVAMASDFTRLSQALWRFLPKLTGDRSLWLMICHQGCWDVLLRDSEDRRPAEQLEALAERVLIAAAGRGSDAMCVPFEDLTCFPLMVGGHPAGMLLVRNAPPLTTQSCRALEAAAAMTAIAVRNVQTLIETRDNSLRDGLTGCFNRAHAVDTLKSELRRATRKGAPLSMVMFDVDHFKQVNDTYGHIAGDQLLAEVGRRLDELLRTTDVKCRYGGDEFLILLPDTPAAGARRVAESIRQHMSDIVLRTGDAEVRVTVSVGVACAEREELDATSFIARADRALYSAKRAGRDRVSGAEADSAASLRLVSVAV